MKENYFFHSELKFVLVVVVPAILERINLKGTLFVRLMLCIEILVIHGTVISRRASGSIWIKDYRIIYFFVCRRQCYNIFDKGFCCLVCFLRKLWVWEKIHLKFVKPWELKKLPWDREEGSETVWHTVKPWELRGRF